jgi:type VI secretion system secreted protein VgrG
MDDVFTFTSSAFPATTRVATFRGHEELSAPYRFEVFLLVPGEDAKTFDVPDALGTLATLSTHADVEHPFIFHGVLMNVELVHAHDRFALFRAVLAPRLQRLALTHHSRLFTEMSLPDILKDVLESNGLTGEDYSLQLTSSYAPEEHVCQYRESDLAFISRWMEHAGLYYFFEQGETAEKLIITDSKASQSDLPTDPVRYVPTLGDDRAAGEAMESFRFRANALPGSFRVKDYDYTKPSLDISGEARVQKSGAGEICVYSGRVFTPGDAAKLATLRAEELLAGQVEHFGSGTMHLRAGYQFTLEEHPLDLLNQKYLATACDHFGNLVASSPELAHRIDIPYKDTYRCEVTAMPASVQFRPQRRAPWPRVYGFENGLIDGPQDSDYAQLDDHGRYRVKFFFDESTLKDGKASTLVRMMQPHGGGIEGFHFPLRKGTEVVLSFMGGDPDRPVIAGVVNTTTTPSPVTSGNNTRNVIQTGGRNRIEIEDKAGQERITLSSPHSNSYVRMGAPNDSELHLHTDANGLIETGVAFTETIGTQKIVTVGATFDETITGAVKETYNGGQTTTITGAKTLSTTGAHTEKTGGEYHTTRSSGHINEVTGGVNETISGGEARTVNGGIVETVNGNYVLNVSGLFDMTTGPTTFKHGPVTCSYDAHTKTTIGATLETFIGAQSGIFIGGKHSATIGINLTTNLALNTTLSASADITVAAGMKATYGTTVVLRAAPKDVTDAGVISAKAIFAKYAVARAAWTCAKFAVETGVFKVYSPLSEIS